MVERADRIAEEIAHGRRLRAEAPGVWSWATPAGRRRELRRAELLVEAGQFAHHDRVLELGCGVGNITRIVFDRTRARITGIDVSPDLLEEAARRVPECRFEVADIHRLPFAEGAFDAVYGSSVLHHLELAPALQEIRRVLRPGGRCAFAEPNMLNPQVFVIKNVPAVKRRMFETPHETAFVRGIVARRFEHAGFQAVRTQPFDFLHPDVPPPIIDRVERLGLFLERVPLMREIAGSCLIYAEKPAISS